MEAIVLVKVILMILLAAVGAVLVVRNQKLRTPIQIILLIAIILLGYWIYESIMDPIRFGRDRAVRETATIERLIDIRNAQLAYEGVFEMFAPTWDSLYDFLENGEIPVVLKQGEVDTMSEERALAEGLIIRDTTYQPALEVLFKDKPEGFDYKELKYVPFTDNKEEFFLDAGVVNKNNIKVNVFEASVPYEVLLNGLKEQYILSLIDTREQLEKFEGLKVGSMEEPTRDGNWE